MSCLVAKIELNRRPFDPSVFRHLLYLCKHPNQPKLVSPYLQLNKLLNFPYVRSQINGISKRYQGQISAVACHRRDLKQRIVIARDTLPLRNDTNEILMC